ncbi:MAG TPA: YbhB/YbcL family Raf kinase inhibitor-like protein [Steroidobacteraceae bacterium]|nr:YbhB/YbcL family Raf kinase inhibitor-like protein [Steroidobacteraceae bacterium]
MLILTLSSAPAFATMSLTSTDFVAGDPIPSAHIYPRCGGRNISPQLSWTGAPADTKSFVLTMIDVDVMPSQWSHWIVIDLPPQSNSLARGTPSLPGKAKAIAGNFGDAHYDGPCPPKGTGVHHYVFTVWALPTATISLASDEAATRVTATLERLALDRASLSAFVQAPGN